MTIGRKTEPLTISILVPQWVEATRTVEGTRVTLDFVEEEAAPKLQLSDPGLDGTGADGSRVAEAATGSLLIETENGCLILGREST